MEPVTISYNNKVYRRNPKARQRAHQVYYWCHDKWKSSPQSLHRQIYIDNFGPIPEKMHVHHKDHNPFNNDLSNLQLIEPGKHSSHHMLTPERKRTSATQATKVQHLTKAWHASPEGRAWHKEHARKVWAKPKRFDRVCEVCGNKFKSYHSNGRRCSRKCQAAAWRLGHPDYYNVSRKAA